jgi:hypothetical protein
MDITDETDSSIAERRRFGIFFDKFVGLMNLVWGFNIIQICRVVNWKKVATCNKVK